MATLAAISTPRTDQTIIGGENDTATSKNIYICRAISGFSQNRPTDRIMADIKGNLQIRLPPILIFFDCIHALNWLVFTRLNWNQDKVR